MNQQHERSGIVTMLSDFGIRDTYVAQMKGVTLSIAPGAMIIDLTHEISPQDVIEERSNWPQRGNRSRRGPRMSRWSIRESARRGERLRSALKGSISFCRTTGFARSCSAPPSRMRRLSSTDPPRGARRCRSRSTDETCLLRRERRSREA